MFNPLRIQQYDDFITQSISSDGITKNSEPASMVVFRQQPVHQHFRERLPTDTIGIAQVVRIIELNKL